MSRLIDADANREEFKKIAYRTLNDYTITTKKKFNLIMTAFDNMPTAYDIEKVVAQLEEEKFGRCDDSKRVLGYAQEYVRKGGLSGA